MQLNLCHLGAVAVKMRKGACDSHHLILEFEGSHDITVILSIEAWNELFTQHNVLLMRTYEDKMQEALRVHR